MKQLAQQWQNDFSWREAEAKMNRFKQFKVDIEDISLHFIHEKSSFPNAIALVMIHGWR